MKSPTLTIAPRPLFDTLDHLSDLYKRCQIEDSRMAISNWLKNCCAGNAIESPEYVLKEYYYGLLFLYSYRGSLDTFNAYRREIERFVYWCWFDQKKSVLELKRFDIESFIEFCQNPPKQWIGLKSVSRFIDKEAERVPNLEWRPFIVKVSKKAFQDGQRPLKAEFELSQQALKQIFAVLGVFYNSLIQDEITETNPVLQIRQKSKFLRKQATSPTIRRLSEPQWQAVLATAQELADKDQDKHKRTLFIMQALYGMYLRISELATTPRWQPKMSDFFRNSNGDWWFRTVGKGNKLRQIAVSISMLEALKQYRGYLGLTPPHPR